MALKILYNCKVLSIENEKFEADAIAIEDGKIIAVGKYEEIKRTFASGDETIDLCGGTVAPGFADTHFHMIMTGIKPLQMQLYEARSFDDIIEGIRSWDRAHPGERWICGWGLDDQKLKEKHLPTADDLDKAQVNKPVWLLRVDGNACCVNSMALERIYFSLEDFSVDKKPSGRASGIFKVPANFAIRSQVLNQNSEDTKKKAIVWAAEKALSYGITCVHAMEYLEDISTLKETFENLPLKVVLYGRSDDLDRCAALGLKRVAGDILLDGTFGCYTAALSYPYADKPQEKGVLYYAKREDFLLALMKRIMREEMQSAFHAIGDKAIEMALDLFEGAFGQFPELPIRQRIEHFVLPSAEQMDRVSRLGVMTSMSPAGILPNCVPGGTYFQRVGSERVQYTLPFKQLFDKGVVVGANSDSPVYDMNPLWGIHSVVNAPFASQRIGVRNALQLYTTNPAKMCFLEDSIGSISIGKCADIVVLDQNPFEARKEVLKDIKARMTFVDGVLRYEASE